MVATGENTPTASSPRLAALRGTPSPCPSAESSRVIRGLLLQPWRQGPWAKGLWLPRVAATWVRSLFKWTGNGHLPDFLQIRGA